MALLEHYTYDVFLSYGWAGLGNPDEGDRGWVATFKRELQIQLSGALGYSARIYLDVEDSQNGELPSRLYEAVASSAIFLSVISHGSCRDDSWCRRELAMFDDAECLVLSGRRQIFSILLWNVPQREWPAGLQSMTPVSFHNERGGPVPASHLTDTGETAGDKVQSLAIDIAEVLRRIDEQVRKTVFVGWTPAALTQRTDRLTREILARGGLVVRPNLRDGESEHDFVPRVERLARHANIAVLLMPGTVGTRHDGWSDTIETLQMQITARRFGNEHRRLIVWSEPGPGGTTPGAQRAEGQSLDGTGFEYVLDVINECAERYATAAATPPAMDSPATTYVFVKCLPQDAARLAPFREAFEARGIRIRLPIFEGEERRRNEINQTLIQRSRAVAVYFGSLNDLEAYDACQTVSKNMPDAAATPRAVLLDPDTDPIRQNFWYPEFESYPSSSVDRVVEHLLGGRTP